MTSNIPNAILILGALYALPLLELSGVEAAFAVIIIIASACDWNLTDNSKEEIALLKSRTHMNNMRAVKHTFERELNESKKRYYEHKAHYYRMESEISEHELKQMKEK